MKYMVARHSNGYVRYVPSNGSIDPTLCVLNHWNTLTSNVGNKFNVPRARIDSLATLYRVLVLPIILVLSYHSVGM